MTIAQGGNDFENGTHQFSVIESYDYPTVEGPMTINTAYAVISSAQNNSPARFAAASTEGEEIGSAPATSTTGDVPTVARKDMIGPGNSADPDRQETICSASACTQHATVRSQESLPVDMPMVRNVAYGLVTPKPTATDSTERRVAN